MKAHLEAKNIFFEVNKSLILSNINFVFAPREIVCLLGNNGSGKSTLLKLCAGILKPSSGEMRINKTNILQISNSKRSNIIGWQPQNLERPFHMSVSEFFALTPVGSRVQNPFPHNYFQLDGLMFRDIATLSGGEWKRAQLTRLWQTQCPILLLDEPDSDLDLRHKKLLAFLCKKYVQENNATLVVATHDIVFAKEVATRVCAISQGRLVWDSGENEFWKSKVINKIFSTKVY